MNKRSIKRVTFIRLMQIFVLAIFVIIFVMFFAYKQFFRYTVENKAIEISKLVKAGLTSHMKAGIMDKRDYFLNEIKTIDNIKSLSIIRAKPVIEQFGNSSHKNEKNYQEMKNKGNLDENSFIWNEKEGYVTAIIPYKANATAQLNCLSCHHAQKGDTLGALELTLDIQAYQNLTSTYGYLLISMLMLFAFLILLIIFNFLEKYLSKPLASIAEDAEEAYKNHSRIDAKKYEVSELHRLAQNLNDLNTDVMKTEDQLREKNAELKFLNSEIESTLRETMVAIGEVEEMRSKDVKNHTRRVALLSATIAEDYGLSKSDVKLIELTSPLHDIGKIGISDDILLKPGKLTSQEYEVMKTHAEIGHNILGHSDRLALKTAAQIAYGHHERYDGSGYPQGLKGDSIPIFARIVAIVDVLDALLCRRVYKEAWNTEDVLTHIIKEKGKHFDPKLVDIVENNFQKYSKLIESLVQKETRPE